jgi:hypothetical protein
LRTAGRRERDENSSLKIKYLLLDFGSNPSEWFGALRPQASLPRLHQTVVDFTAADADILQIPIAEPTQHDKTCLPFAMSDHGGNPAIDLASEARQKNAHSSPDGWRGIAWGGVEHRHGFSFAGPPF